MSNHTIDVATGQLLVNGEPYLIRGVELHNSTSSSAECLRPLWKRFADAGVNTVLAPVSWELVEPHESEFDFALVDVMLSGARQHGLKLVLLWFGSWKNGCSSYTPAWVKLDPSRFPLQTDAHGEPYDNLSPFSVANRDADATAFAAFMKHLARVDGREGTVVMVQVENEVGLLGAARSHGEDATAAWAAPVPPALMAAVRAGAFPHVSVPADVSAATWDGLKGDTDRTAELFMAWHYADYVEHVAAAGREHHDVPLFVNAWLDSVIPDDSGSGDAAFTGGQVPGVFASGGRCRTSARPGSWPPPRLPSSRRTCTSATSRSPSNATPTPTPSCSFPRHVRTATASRTASWP
ncbi:beta-galactosidase [Streptomyces flaveolus]|uniref:beta-galactosidase n=1 Tax=Streptomyces flaveolus TaxID=67297 RepID=UPI0033F4856F